MPKMAKSYLARIVSFGPPVPGKNSQQLWVDRSRCPARKNCRAIPRTSPNKRLQKYQRELARDALCSMQGAPCSGRLIRVTGTIYVGDVVVRDLTNMLEAVFDALQKIAYHNDFQIHEIGNVVRRLDRQTPRAELTLWEIEDAVWEEAREKAWLNREKTAERKKKACQVQGRLV